MLWYLSETVTDKVFDTISKELGGSDWRRLGLKLGLTDKELDNLKTNYRSSILDCITAMLRQWRGNPVTEASMTVLRAALVDIQRNDLAAFIGKLTFHHVMYIFSSTLLICFSMRSSCPCRTS